MEMSLFERASRYQYKFDSNVGQIGVDQLWNLPLTHATKVSLNDIARRVYDRLGRARENVDFVGASTEDPTVPVLRDKLEIVKRVIAVRKAENDAKDRERNRSQQKEKLVALLSEKEDEALRGKSAEEIRQLLAAL